MRRSFSFLVAAAVIAAVSAASFVPAQAAAPRPAPAVTGSAGGAIIEVGGRWETFHGDRHNAWRDDGWGNDWRWRNRHHRRNRHHGNFFPNQFYFGFPFAFVQPYHNRRNDCFRTWDGQLICR